MDFHLSASTDLPYEEAVVQVRQALADHGFGVITEIDMRATLAAKTGDDIEPYLILGACSPELAEQALAVDPRVGVLLPCNVTVSTRDGRTHIGAMDPAVLTAFDGTEALAPIAREAAERLRAVLADASASQE